MTILVLHGQCPALLVQLPQCEVLVSENLRVTSLLPEDNITVCGPKDVLPETCLDLRPGTPVHVNDGNTSFDGRIVTDERKDGCTYVKLCNGHTIKRVQRQHVTYQLYAQHPRATIHELETVMNKVAWEITTNEQGERYITRNTDSSATLLNGFRSFMQAQAGNHHGLRRGAFPKRVARQWARLTMVEKNAWALNTSLAVRPAMSKRDMQKHVAAAGALLHLCISPPRHVLHEDDDKFRETFTCIISDLSRCSSARPFLHNFVLHSLVLADDRRHYCRIITKPVDLQYILDNLNIGAYGTDSDAVCNDLSLIWDNATAWSIITMDDSLAASAAFMRSVATNCLSHL